MLLIKKDVKELCNGNFKKVTYRSKEAVLNSNGTNIFNLHKQDTKIKNEKMIDTVK